MLRKDTLTKTGHASTLHLLLQQSGKERRTDHRGLRVKLAGSPCPLGVSIASVQWPNKFLTGQNGATDSRLKHSRGPWSVCVCHTWPPGNRTSASPVSTNRDADTRLPLVTEPIQIGRPPGQIKWGWMFFGGVSYRWKISSSVASLFRTRQWNQQ